MRPRLRVAVPSETAGAGPVSGSRRGWVGTVHSPRLLALGAGLVLLMLAVLAGRWVSGVDLLPPAGIVLMTALAYANGANDVSKAIATLAGSGLANYRRALAWGTCCTILGSLASVLLASALIGTFTNGFLVSQVQETEVFALAVLLDACLWVLLAARLALPVSTTHAITGSLVTVGAFAFGASNVQWANLVRKVALPLALSPFLALVLAMGVSLLISALLARRSPGILNGAHWLSSGTASFARGATMRRRSWPWGSPSSSSPLTAPPLPHRSGSFCS